MPRNVLLRMAFVLVVAIGPADAQPAEQVVPSNRVTSFVYIRARPMA